MYNTKRIICVRLLICLRSVGDSTVTELWNHALVLSRVIFNLYRYINILESVKSTLQRLGQNIQQYSVKINSFRVDLTLLNSLCTSWPIWFKHSTCCGIKAMNDFGLRWWDLRDCCGWWTKWELLSLCELITLYENDFY